MGTSKYSHGFTSIINYFGLILLISPIIRLIVLVFEALNAYFQGVLTAEVGYLAGSLCITILIFAIATYLTSTIYNTYSDFIIKEDGLRVRVFNLWFFWVLIPWKKVKSLQPSPRKTNVWAILVDMEITIWHRRLGKLYGLGKEPAILVVQSLENREEFLSQIRKRIQEID